MSEARYTQRINTEVRSLGVYAWKTSDRFTRGIPDCYYTGHSSHLWAEFKYAKIVKGLLRPRLSAHQTRWLEMHHNLGHPVCVIIGTPRGGYLYLGDEWKTPCRAEHICLMTAKQIAHRIKAITGIVPDQHDKPTTGRRPCPVSSQAMTEKLLKT